MSIEAGNLLRETRENKGLSIKEASDALHIRIPYLQALENGRAEIIPSLVQTRGFLRIYSEYLGLDPVMMIREWDQPGAYPPPDSLSGDKVPPDFAELTPLVQTIPSAPFPPPVIMPESTPLQAERTGTGTISADAPSDVSSPVKAPEKEPVEPSKDKPVDERKRGKKRKDKNLPAPKNEQDLEAEAQKLFDEIGSQLSYRRKFLSLSIEDCESQTLIRSIYIESMENGKFDQLPSFIQARGMLNNYASFLDLDVDEIMLKLATALQLLSQKKN